MIYSNYRDIQIVVCTMYRYGHWFCFQRLTIPSTCPEKFASLMKKCWLAEPKVNLLHSLYIREVT